MRETSSSNLRLLGCKRLGFFVAIFCRQMILSCIQRVRKDKRYFEGCLGKLIEERYRCRPRAIYQNKLKRTLPLSGCVYSAQLLCREIPPLLSVAAEFRFPVLHLNISQSLPRLAGFTISLNATQYEFANQINDGRFGEPKNVFFANEPKKMKRLLE